MKCSRFSVISWKYSTFHLQPLRQKSKIFATSPYTGEALAGSLTSCKNSSDHSEEFLETVKKAGYEKRLPCVKGAVSEAD